MVPAPRAEGRLGALRLAAVGALLLLTFAIRVRGLPGNGPVEFDEGWAIADGRFVATFLTHPGRWGALFGGLHLRPFGNLVKIGHDLLLGPMANAGLSPENLTWYSALAGGVMVLALAALAWKRWGAPAAAVAGVFAGTLPLSIAYGHRVLAEADGLAGVALLLLLLDRWWAARPSARLTAATVFVFLVTEMLNYRFAPILLPILLLMGWLAWWYRRHDLPPRVSVARMTPVFLAPTAAIVSIYLLLAAANRFGLSGPATLQRLFLRSGVGVPTPFASPDFYVRLLWDFGGPVVIATAGLAFLALLSRWKNLDPLAVVAAGSFAGIFLFFSAVHDKAPRAIVLWIPFAALVVANAFSLPRLRGRLGWGLAALICGACLINGWIGSDQARLVSGTGQVGRWLAAHPGTIFAERFPNVVIYTEHQWDLTRGLDPAHAIVVPAGNVTIDNLRQKGVRWVVVDADALSYGDPAFKDVAACGQPVAEFNDPAGWSQLQFLETADSLHLGYDGVLAQRNRTLALSHGKQTIRIFDLATLPASC